ncbi:hypothetical protein Vadar_019079 [Vaccinium darrowii]|uniref:Uncharacterized protein n=1 Tax=Vaccinium darrowii TaxID=229202 RepID=A0ACB7Y7Q1_9ERIC|nr:hypothetical protein Vadar_019079 [Vaccinium darrowii]
MLENPMRNWTGLSSSRRAINARGKWLLRSTKIRQARDNNEAIVKPPVSKPLKRKRSTPSPTTSAHSFTSENSVQLTTMDRRKNDVGMWSYATTEKFIEILLEEAKKEQSANTQLQTVAFPNEVWDDLLQKNPDYGKFRDKPIDHRNMLEELLEGALANGAFANPSVKPMSSSSIPPPNIWETYFSDGDEDLLDLEFLELGMEDEFEKMPQRTSEQTGQAYVNFLLDGHPQTIKDILRVDAFTFRALVAELVSRGQLQWDKKHLCVEESLAIFLYICGHSERHRMAADRFQRSTSTISTHFKLMRRAICNLAPHIIRPPDLHVTPPEILNDDRYFPWFQDCVGAIDGTQIEAWVPRNRQVASRGRKPTITQNVMAVCSFDMKFTYVYPGWEGSAHDGRVFNAAVSNPANNFPGIDEFFEGFTDPFHWAGGNDNQGNAGNVVGVEPINMSPQNIQLMAQRREQMAFAMWDSYDE